MTRATIVLAAIVATNAAAATTSPPPATSLVLVHPVSLDAAPDVLIRPEPESGSIDWRPASESVGSADPQGTASSVVRWRAQMVRPCVGTAARMVC